MIQNDVKYKVVTNSLARIKYLYSFIPPFDPPQTENGTFIEYFNNYLNDVSMFDGHNIVMGDFIFLL